MGRTSFTTEEQHPSASLGADDRSSISEIEPESSVPYEEQHYEVSTLDEAAVALGEQATVPTVPASSGRVVLGLTTIVNAASATLRTKWFWYSIASALCWTVWAFTARLGSRELPSTTMQFVSSFGFLLVGVGLALAKNVQIKTDHRGNSYALISGVLLGLGGIALYGAYRTAENASVITATTSLYPVVTVIFAVAFLREKLNKLQVFGLGFAVAAILLFSA